MEEMIKIYIILFLLIYCIYLHGVWIKTDSLWEISSGINLLQNEKINGKITDKEFNKLMERILSIREDILNSSWIYLFFNKSFLIFFNELSPLNKLYKLTEDILVILNKKEREA